MIRYFLLSFCIPYHLIVSLAISWFPYLQYFKYRRSRYFYVTDQAHVQTKSNQSLAESRDITYIQSVNPLSSPVIDYRTSLDPALIAYKNLPLDQRILDLAGNPVPAWYSRFGTGISQAEIFHKSSLFANGKQQVMVGDGPWVNDIGPIVDIPQVPASPSLEDNWHKIVTTDLSSTNVVIATGIQFPSVPFLTTGLYNSQNILFPISSRHIVKTPDGALHAVCSYIISSLSRIVYLKSVTGGETWISTVVDNNDGHHYLMPSITCDQNNGIHITFTRYDQVLFDTYWLYCGGATPDGFELVSSAGNIAYHRLLFGNEGLYWPTLADNPDTYYDHDHVHGTTDGSVTACGNYTIYGDCTRAGCYWHHAGATVSMSLSSMLPLSRSLKLLRYHGIPTSLPADIIVPFKSNVPAGYTRYSDQDHYPIYCSNDVGTIVGATQHRHLVHYRLYGSASCNGQPSAGGAGTPASCEHEHEGDVYTSYEPNSVPSYGVILGKVAAPISILAVDALILASAVPLLIQLTSLSAHGEVLHDKYLVGHDSYGDLGGTTLHDHDDMSFDTVGGNSSGNVWTIITTPPGPVSLATGAHAHHLAKTIDDATPFVSAFGPRIYAVNTQLDLSTYGNDLFYRYISPIGSLAAPVNISLIKTFYPSFEGVCLVDGSDNVHFAWSAQGLNTTLGRARICYNKLSGGVLGVRASLTVSDNHMLFPSMDIDRNGDIHVAWFNATTNQSVEYRKYSGGAWAAVEVVDNASYVGNPSNIVTDNDCNTYLMYAHWTDAGTPIKEIYYRVRTVAGAWSAATNLSPGKLAAGYNQYPGQIYLDNKGNVVFTWSGKGYGAHTGVYHPVYRYLTASGTIVPAVGSDAIDLFPLDDTEIFYPTVFWHSYPFVDGVYQNLVTSGLTFVYLYNPRNGATKDTADLRFYSSPNALVGDAGAIGTGGEGDGDFVPGGVSGESILQNDSYAAVMRGYIGRSGFARTAYGNYMV
jgi:hypothetical protein